MSLTDFANLVAARLDCYVSSTKMLASNLFTVELSSCGDIPIYELLVTRENDEWIRENDKLHICGLSHLLDLATVKKIGEEVQRTD